MKWQVPRRQKLVQFLQQQLAPAPSGKFLRRVLEANLCRVNGSIERFGSREVERHAIVELAPSWKDLAAPLRSTWTPLYEDEEFLVIDKPAGWVCTPAACREALGPNRFLAHRLDKETTGALLIAKGKGAEEQALALFRERKIEKHYLAWVDGIPREERGVIRNFLAKKQVLAGQTVWGSAPHGLLAETHWCVVRKGRNAALLECQPITGRTHQIRVHLAEMGHPILIDRQYAKTFRSDLFFQRPLLHAAKLRFLHPSQEKWVEVEASLPTDFQAASRQLGGELLVKN